MPHLRPPSVARGVTSFIWAVVLAAFIWAGLSAIGASQPTAVILAVVCFCGIFLYVRLYGEDAPGS